MPHRTKQPAGRVIMFDRHRFWKEEAERDFDNIWFFKSVVVERFWKIEHFRGEDFMLEQNFEGRGWLKVARFNPSCVADVVREFFANFKAKSVIRRWGRERLISWVRGVEITLTPDDFASIFQIPRVEHPEFSYPTVGVPPFDIVAREILEAGQSWGDEYRKPVSVLQDKYWALHMFSCSNLLPQNRNSDCTRTRASLIYAIGTGMTIDLASYMWSQIAYTCEHPHALAALPFGGALTEIFRLKGARIGDDLPIASGLQPFTNISYTKSRGLSKKRKTTEDTASLGEPSHAQEASEEGTEEAPTSDLAAQIGVLSDRISAMEHNQESDHQLLLQLVQGQQTQEHLMRTMLDYIRESQPPPPPQ